MATTTTAEIWNRTIVLLLLLFVLQCIVILTVDRYGENENYANNQKKATSSSSRSHNYTDSDSGDNFRAQLQTASNIRGSSSNSRSNNRTATTAVAFEGVKARAYQSWPADVPLPCYEAEKDWNRTEQGAQQRPPTRKGFLFLKSYKTGSSTSSGVTLRIARNVAKRQKKNYGICKSRFRHAWASDGTKGFRNRNRDRSFLWTIVRHPTNRIVSQWFHFEVSRRKVEPSDDNFFQYVSGDDDMIRDNYLSQLSLNGYRRGVDNPVATANGIINEYDFIAVTERMDESMMAMAMILGVPIADILYLSAKGRGSWDDAGGREEIICTYIWPSFVTGGMQKVLDSNEWRIKSHWDAVLYEVANRSLDLTIDRLGRVEFEENLKLYRHARDVSRERCLHKTIFPCTSGGELIPENATDCLWRDSACGMECLDRVADELNLW